MSDQLPSEFPESPVIGDGVVTLPIVESGGDILAGFDLPPGLAAQLASETGANINQTAHSGRMLSQQLAAAMGAQIARIPNEPSVIGSRTVSGIMATPIASPTLG
jgi:hypothetical protein